MKIKRIIGAFCVFFAGLGGTVICHIGFESKTSSFNDMVVRHAKRLCNGGLCKVFEQDGRDFVDFWFTANEVNLDLEKAYTSLRLFYNNFKSCEAIDDTVVDRSLEVVPRLFDRYFSVDPAGIREINIVRDGVEDLLLENFTDKFEQFQVEPDIFISRISRDITDIVKSRVMFMQQEEEERQLREKFRNMIIRFSDLMLNKMIWYEEYYERIWPTVTSVADNLHRLGTRGILNDQDNLDELWDSLVRRFVWFLDFKGASLPVEFYEQIEDDLNSNSQLFLVLDEQDDGIVTKKDMIREAIIRAKAKAIAGEKGLILAAG